MPTNDYLPYLQHHGILGMKWGVRRYQPYSTTGPRKGGKTGKEIGNAKKAAKRLNKADKKIVWARYKTKKAERSLRKAELLSAGTKSDLKKVAKKQSKYEKQKNTLEEREKKVKDILDQVVASGKLDVYTKKVSRSVIGKGKLFARLGLAGGASLILPSTYKRDVGTKYKVFRKEAL